MKMIDTIIRNARTVDIHTGAEQQVDLGISQGLICSVVPAGQLTLEARNVIDAAGLWLFPGFIDYHVHLFRHGSTFGMQADRLLEAGVTLAVDMGSAGWVNYPAFHVCDVATQRLPVYAYLNISPIGQPGKGIAEPLEEALMSREKMQEMQARYPGEIRGIKVRISRNIVKNLGLAPLKAAVKMGESLGLPVCVHTTDPPASPAEIVSVLRPGDVYSHTYMGQGHTILEDGHVPEELFRAQQQGVLFEVGNGLKNFNFPVANAAFADGLMPDIISSDSTPSTFHNGNAMWDLSLVMSKFLTMGMPLKDVLQAVTLTPAKRLGLENVAGQIAEGRPADLVLCRMDNTEFTFLDSEGNSLKGSRGIVPCRTILHGETVWSES